VDPGCLAASGTVWAASQGPGVDPWAPSPELSEIAQDDPDSAYVLAYDAARYSATALLARQGLRPTTSGGHYAVELAVRAQFGDGFRAFGAMRRRRNELEYPGGPGETTTPDEAGTAITDAGRLHRAAQQLLATLPIF